MVSEHAYGRVRGRKLMLEFASVCSLSLSPSLCLVLHIKSVAQEPPRNSPGAHKKLPGIIQELPWSSQLKNTVSVAQELPWSARSVVSSKDLPK